MVVGERLLMDVGLMLSVMMVLLSRMIMWMILRNDVILWCLVRWMLNRFVRGMFRVFGLKGVNGWVLVCGSVMLGVLVRRILLGVGVWMLRFM